MLSKKIVSALNEQVNAELYSSYLYWSMAAQLHSIGRRGMAHYMEVQAKEEMMHAVKFYRYIVDSGGQAVMMAIDMPPAAWDSILDVMRGVMEHEQKVTFLINGLVDLSKAEGDKATMEFLQWYVEEQEEEEENAMDILSKAENADRSELKALDEAMGKRSAPFHISANVQ